MKDKALSIIRTLREDGRKAVLAGGCVRDSLIEGRVPKDYDVATCALPERVLELYPHSVRDGQDQGVIKVIIDKDTIDVATLRRDGSYSDGRRPDSVEFTDSLEEDARRRDFSMNAMFYDPIEDKIIDFHNGQEDIRNRVIRAVGNASDRFMEDKLRMMRAVRFSCQLGFMMDEEVVTSISQLAEDVAVVISAERIRDELYKILACYDPVYGIGLMRMTGLLRYILPEVHQLKGVLQDRVHHPEGDVWIHSLGVLRSMVKLSNDTDLRFAALLHDIGKFYCHSYKLDKEGVTRITHIGHDTKGAEVFDELAPRFALSNDQKRKIRRLIEVHMTAHKGKEMRRSKLVSFLREEFINEIILLQFCDGMNSGHADKPLREFYLQKLSELEPEITSECVLRGGDVLALGYREGRIIGTILDWVRVQQDEGLVNGKEEAEKAVLEMFPPPDGVRLFFGEV